LLDVFFCASTRRPDLPINRAHPLDRLTLAEYSIDDNNEAFTIDDLGNRDSVNVRDGNNVNYDIDNLASKRGNAGGKGLKSESRRGETVRDHSHFWPASSTGACWNNSKKMDRKVKIVNYIRWLSLVPIQA
jgi:hypothetical protein